MRQSRKRNLSSYVKAGGGLDFNNIAKDPKQKKLIDDDDD